MSTRHISDYKAKYRAKGILTAGKKGKYIPVISRFFVWRKTVGGKWSRYNAKSPRDRDL